MTVILLGLVSIFVVMAVVLGIAFAVNWDKRSSVQSDPHHQPKPKTPPTAAELKELEQLPPDVLDALKSRQKILAIKLYREETGVGLKEAKTVIDNAHDILN